MTLLEKNEILRNAGRGEMEIYFLVLSLIYMYIALFFTQQTYNMHSYYRYDISACAATIFVNFWVGNQIFISQVEPLQLLSPSISHHT